MIVPMKKYSFLVYHKDYQKFLQQLQDLGVLHVIEKADGELVNEQLKEQYQQIYRLTAAIKFLEKRKTDKKEETASEDGLSILEEFENVRFDKEVYNQQLTSLEKERAQVEPWGSFSPETIQKVRENGYNVKLYVSSIKQFDEQWVEQYNALKINEAAASVYFVTVTHRDVNIDIDAEEVKIPERSIDSVQAEIKRTKELIDKSEEVLDQMSMKYIPSLKKKRSKIQESFEFDKVILNTEKKAEEKLMVLEGWVPKDRKDKTEEFLTNAGVYYEVERPTIKENVPVKLKNNRFARLFESIGELYTYPEYKELDLTPFFAPFYMLFFGFCLGDAGYGLLITVGTIIAIYRGPQKFQPLFKLGMFLGIATIIMGLVSGTFFGIMLAEKPWPWLQQYQRFVLDNDNLMLLALILGYIQVLMGMFIKAANKAKIYGFKHSISQYGWITIVMVTVPAIILGSQGIIEQSTANNIIIASAIIGGIPALFYNSPGKNPFLNFGVGLWNTYETASGLLGDVLSYIRLFALGISSAILGNVFNSLALDLSPDTIIIRQLVIVLILAFGHSLNFFMASLGSFVHPLRLTFVEFYKNAGFSGGGNKYEPFRNNIKN